jgi:hypothetical protein
VRPSARSWRYSTPRSTLPVMRPLISPSNATSIRAPCRPFPCRLGAHPA